MTPVEAVSQYVAKHLKAPGFCVAYSGGVDSHVLLVLMADLARRDRSLTLRAVHVNHGLQSQSAAWAKHARAVCEGLGVPLEVRDCHVKETGKGPEANARQARYKEFAAVLRPGEHMLLGQHAEDQAETFLLQALRGSGPDGLAGIPRKRHFASGYLGRPLLFCSKKLMLSVAQKRGLQWVEDPSNQNLDFDRNFLRAKIMPLLRSRWSAAPRTLGRSASRCAAASASMNLYARQDLEQVTQPGLPELSISALAELPRERAYVAIRLWIRQRKLRMPRYQDLRQVYSNLVHAGPESQGIVNCRDYEFRRHRDSLSLVLPNDKCTGFRHEWQAPFDDLFIPETGLTITRSLCKAQRIRLPKLGTVIVKSRAGGELIRVGNPAFHKRVKQILQESAIPPWKRESIPLLYAQGQLIAVWNLAVAADFWLPAENSDESSPADSSTLKTANTPADDGKPDGSLGTNGRRPETV
ncbi:MAG: tRNA lysidine(34) synthetase TilS [Granulosicoccus sp.]